MQCVIDVVGLPAKPNTRTSASDAAPVTFALWMGTVVSKIISPAAELIHERADSSKANMGLTIWKSGTVRKADVSIAKNYLFENEIGELNRIVVMWLDFAEDQAKRRKEVFLKDWEEKLNSFLAFNDRNVLPNSGNLSKKRADTHAEAECMKFAAQRRALLESEGEAYNLNMLEAAAKVLPQQHKKQKTDDKF